MPDTLFITPEAMGALELMIDAEASLPVFWQTNTFWLSAAQWLAQFIADHKGEAGVGDLGNLVGIGALLVASARAEHEAKMATAAFFTGGPADD